MLKEEFHRYIQQQEQIHQEKDNKLHQLTKELIFAQEKSPYALFTKSGNKTNYAKLLREASQSEVVLFGEYHDHSVVQWLAHGLVDTTWWQVVMLGAQILVMALTPSSYTRSARRSMARHIYLDTAPILPGFTVLAALLSLPRMDCLLLKAVGRPLLGAAAAAEALPLLPRKALNLYMSLSPSIFPLDVYEVQSWPFHK